MKNEYCPKCGTNKNVQTSDAISPAKSKDAKDLKIIRSYHCETCGSFIRSEEMINNGSRK